MWLSAVIYCQRYRHSNILEKAASLVMYIPHQKCIYDMCFDLIMGQLGGIHCQLTPWLYSGIRSQCSSNYTRTCNVRLQKLFGGFSFYQTLIIVLKCKQSFPKVWNTWIRCSSGVQPGACTLLIIHRKWTHTGKHFSLISTTSKDTPSSKKKRKIALKDLTPIAAREHHRHFYI